MSFAKTITIFLVVIASSVKSLSQNVGIGTNTPQSTLDVKGNQRVGGTNHFLAFDSTTGKYSLSGSYVWAPAAQYLMMHSASSEGLYYDNATIEYRNSSGNPVFFTNWNNGHGYFSNRLGIGTTIPLARLHVADSTVIFSAPGDVTATPANLPVTGQGKRMLWYPDKAAFRAGYVNNDQWDKGNIGYYSFAAGFNTKASGNQSTALGMNTTASASMSFAAGYNTVASNAYCVATGMQTVASGEGSTAFGIYSQSTSTASTAMGLNSLASGYYSTAGGFNSIASGVSSVAMGWRTIASGGSGIAMGQDAMAIGHISVSLGGRTMAKAFGAFACGLFNDSTDSPDIVIENPQDRIFQIGNGAGFNTFRSNAMTVLRNGNVGIGHLTPIAPLSFASKTGEKIALYGDAAPNYGIGVQPYLMQLHTDAALSDIAFGYGSSDAFTETMRIKGNGALAFNGNTGQTGQVLTSNGNTQSPEWKNNNSPKYFFFQNAPGSSTALTTSDQNVTSIHNQSFTLDFPATLIVTIGADVHVAGGETTLQEPNFSFYISGLPLLYRTEYYGTLKALPTSYVATFATATRFIPNVPAGNYTLQFSIRKLNASGSCTYGNAQVTIQAIP
jgi:hypothetical protein